MDLELLAVLEDCAAMADRLLNLLDQDTQDMPNCVNGEILAEYQRGLDKALHTASEIKTGLLRLMMPE